MQRKINEELSKNVWNEAQMFKYPEVLIDTKFRVLESNVEHSVKQLF